MNNEKNQNIPNVKMAATTQIAGAGVKTDAGNKASSIQTPAEHTRLVTKTGSGEQKPAVVQAEVQMNQEVMTETTVIKSTVVNEPVQESSERKVLVAEHAAGEDMVSKPTTLSCPISIAEAEPIATVADEAFPVAETSPSRQADIQTEAKPDVCKRTWQVIEEAVAGLAHRQAMPPLPCQDAAKAINKIRPVLVVADGAGSAAVSEIGSQAVVTGTTRLLDTLEIQVAGLLDSAESPADEELRQFALLLVKHARGILADLAAQHRRPLQDFRCTFLLQVAGLRRLLWVKVGDGALVVEETNNPEADKWRLRTLGKAGKGEYANQTTFVDDRLSISDVQSGWEAMDNLCGFAVMSDGCADRLVASDGNRVAGRVGTLLEALRKGKLKRCQLTSFLYHEETWRGTSGDDRSIALAAGEIS